MVLESMNMSVSCLEKTVFSVDTWWHGHVTGGSALPVSLHFPNSTQHFFSSFSSVASVLLAMTRDSRRPHTGKKDLPLPAQPCPEVPFHVAKTKVCDCSFSGHPIAISDGSPGFSFMTTFPLQTLLDGDGGLWERGRRGGTQTKMSKRPDLRNRFMFHPLQNKSYWGPWILAVTGIVPNKSDSSPALSISFRQGSRSEGSSLHRQRKKALVRVPSQGERKKAG